MKIVQVNSLQYDLVNRNDEKILMCSIDNSDNNHYLNTSTSFNTNFMLCLREEQKDKLYLEGFIIFFSKDTCPFSMNVDELKFENSIIIKHKKDYTNIEFSDYYTTNTNIIAICNEIFNKCLKN